MIVELIVYVLCADLVVVVSSVTWVVGLGVYSRMRSPVLYTLDLAVCVGVGHEWYVYVFRLLVVVSLTLVIAKGIAG